MTNTVEILEMVHTFYHDAWSQLVTYTVALLAFVGGLIPLIIHLLQSRSLRTEQTNLKAQITNDIEKIRLDLAATAKDYFAKEAEAITKQIDEAKTELRRSIAIAEAGNFHIQGNANLNSNVPLVAIGSFVTAAKMYMDGQDELNLQRVVRIVKDNCLSKIAKADFTDDASFPDEISELIKLLRSNNVNGRYTDTIEGIETAVRAARRREKVE